MLADRETAIVFAARLAHEANRAYCLSIGDNTQQPWHEAPAWQHKSCIDGVRFLIEHPKATPEDSHNNWLRTKYAEGWTWGPIKDVEAKKHPNMKSYWDLPREQRAKDLIFAAIVRTIFEA